MRYFGASALIFSIRSPICALSSLGGDDVRLSNGSPTWRKKSSSSRGRGHAEHMDRAAGHVLEHMRRVGRDVHRRSGAHGRGLAAEGELELALDEGEHLLEIMAVGRRAAAVGHDHVDQAVATGGVGAGDENAVGVADHGDVAHVGAVGIGERQIAGRIVGGNGGVGHGGRSWGVNRLNESPSVVAPDRVWRWRASATGGERRCLNAIPALLEREALTAIIMKLSV